jgi:hypothetical protein
MITFLPFAIIHPPVKLLHGLGFGRKIGPLVASLVKTHLFSALVLGAQPPNCIGVVVIVREPNDYDSARQVAFPLGHFPEGQNLVSVVRLHESFHGLTFQSQGEFKIDFDLGFGIGSNHEAVVGSASFFGSLDDIGGVPDAPYLDLVDFFKNMDFGLEHLGGTHGTSPQLSGRW